MAGKVAVLLLRGGGHGATVDDADIGLGSPGDTLKPPFGKMTCQG